MNNESISGLVLNQGGERKGIQFSPFDLVYYGWVRFTADSCGSERDDGGDPHPSRGVQPLHRYNPCKHW